MTCRAWLSLVVISGSAGGAVADPVAIFDFSRFAVSAGLEAGLSTDAAGSPVGGGSVWFTSADAFDRLFAQSPADVRPSLLEWTSPVVARFILEGGEAFGPGAPGLSVTYAASDFLSFTAASGYDPSMFGDPDRVEALFVLRRDGLPLTASVGYAPEPGLRLSIFGGIDLDDRLLDAAPAASGVELDALVGMSGRVDF